MEILTNVYYFGYVYITNAYVTGKIVYRRFYLAAKHPPIIILFPLVKRQDKVSASQPRDRWFGPHTGHEHDSSYDTNTG